MNQEVTAFGIAMQAVANGAGPEAIMQAGEGASVALAHMPPLIDDPRAIRIPVHINGGDRSDLEALGFEWREDPREHSRPDDYVTVLMPPDWTAQVCTMYLTVLRDERGVQRVSLYNNHQFWDPFAKTEITNVGTHVAARLCSDDSATLASVRWHSLTDQEQEAVRAALRARDGDPGSLADHWLAKLSG